MMNYAVAHVETGQMLYAGPSSYKASVELEPGTHFARDILLAEAKRRVLAECVRFRGKRGAA